MTKCPFCSSDTDYDTIGNHWRQSCSYPNLSDFEYEIIAGLLAGDATIKNKQIGNASIEIKMINKKFLLYIDNLLGLKSTGVSIKHTSDEVANNLYETSPVSPDCNFNDQYVLVTRNLPDLNPFRDWFSNGEKRIPDEKEITDTMIKYWYVCDGGLSWNKESKSVRAQLTSTNESDRLQNIANTIEEKCGVRPSVYDDRVMFKPSETKCFLSWIGDPVPGFEYKFEVESLSRYESKMRNTYN